MQRLAPADAIVGPMLVLAVVQVFHAHYQLGVGNQTIQIPFLHAAADSSLYSRDLMIQMTMRDYPSYFYRGLGALIGGGDVGGWYFALHLLTAAKDRSSSSPFSNTPAPAPAAGRRRT